MRNQIIQSANADAQLNSAIVSSQPKNKEPHLRISRAFRKKWQPVLPASAWSIYCALVDRLGKNDAVWPEHYLIALDTGLSVSTVKRHLKILKGYGLLDWTAQYKATRKGRAKQIANRYTFGQNESQNQAQNEPKPLSDLNPTPSPKRATKQREAIEEVKNEQDVVSSNSLNVSQAETTTVERLRSFGVPSTTAEQLAADFGTERCERQMAYLEARNAKNPVGALIQSIRGDWSAPDGVEVVATVSPQIAARMVPQGEYRPFKKKAAPESEPQILSTVDMGNPITLPTTPNDTPATNQDNALEPENTDFKAEPKTTVLEDAQRAHAIFLKLRESEQNELLTIARKDVSPIWHDRVGNPESPMSLGLWELVRQNHPEKFS